MSTHNICFYGELEKIIPKLSSNTPPGLSYITLYFAVFFFMQKTDIEIYGSCLFSENNTCITRLYAQQRLRKVCAFVHSDCWVLFGKPEGAFSPNGGFLLFFFIFLAVVALFYFYPNFFLLLSVI